MLGVFQIIWLLIPCSIAFQCWSGQGKGKKATLTVEQCDYNVNWCSRYTDGNSWVFGCGIPRNDPSNLECTCSGYNDENFGSSKQFLYCCQGDLCNFPSSIPEFEYFCNYNHIYCYKGQNNGQAKKGLKEELCYYSGGPGYCKIDEISTGKYQYDCGSDMQNSRICVCNGWARIGSGLRYCCDQSECNDHTPVFTGEVCNAPPPPTQPPPPTPHPVPTQSHVTFAPPPTEKPLPPMTPVQHVGVTTQATRNAKTTPKSRTSSNSLAIVLPAVIFSFL